MKTTIKILLLVAIAALGYFVIMSVMTPIQFETERAKREKVVIERLIDLRTAQIEFRDQKGRYTTGLDTLINFLQTGKKRMVLKEGMLTDAQLQAGLTEAKAVKIVRSGNQKEINANGLQNFRRDTTMTNLINALYNGKYTAENIVDIQYIPFTDNAPFEVELNNNYVNSTGITIPLIEIRAPYIVYLSDINRQETLNLVDLQEKLEKYPGLKVGSVIEPNNFAGNWE
ncbi:MAG: hypothetical protein RBT57_04270 [Paludibacter sp.]|jgi:type II secretory pathway pseudopilin PulG|nr:hypothetical protein [Paludibacter sp.]